MDLLQTALTSVISIIVLFLFTKLMGNKQLSQLSMFNTADSTLLIYPVEPADPFE